MERGFADINYNMATNTCAIQTSMANHTRDIIDSQNAGTRAILDYLCQEKISDLQSENQALSRLRTIIWSASSVLRHPFLLMWLQTHTATAGPQLMVAV